MLTEARAQGQPPCRCRHHPTPVRELTTTAYAAYDPEVDPSVEDDVSIGRNTPGVSVPQDPESDHSSRRIPPCMRVSSPFHRESVTDELTTDSAQLTGQRGWVAPLAPGPGPRAGERPAPRAIRR